MQYINFSQNQYNPNVFLFIPHSYYRRYALADKKQKIGYGNVLYQIYKNNPIDFFVSLALRKNNIEYATALFFEWDSDELKSEREAERLLRFIKRRKFPFTYCQSRRGKHLYIHFNPHPLTRYNFTQLGNAFIEKLNLCKIDKTVLHNLSSLTRVPNTVHSKTQKRIFVIEQSLTSFAKINRIIQKITPVNKSRNSNGITFPIKKPCLEEAMKQDNPTHIQRVLWTASKLHEGLTVEQILQLIEKYHWRDWDYNISRYQVNHIQQGGYKPPSCAYLHSLGICKEFGKKCSLRKKSN